MVVGLAHTGFEQFREFHGRALTDREACFLAASICASGWSRKTNEFSSTFRRRMSCGWPAPSASDRTERRWAQMQDMSVRRLFYILAPCASWCSISIL